MSLRALPFYSGPGDTALHGVLSGEWETGSRTASDPPVPRPVWDSSWPDYLSTAALLAISGWAGKCGRKKPPLGVGWY